MNASHPPSITCPLPGIFLSMNDINTNYFPCLMLYYVLTLGSVAEPLYSSIYILSNDTFQFIILLDITFPIFRNCVPLDISFSLSIQSFSCAPELEGYWQASLDFRENNYTQEECDQKSLPDSAKFYNIMLFPMFLWQKKSFQLQKLFFVKLRIRPFKKKQTFISCNHFMMVSPPVIFYNYT